MTCTVSYAQWYSYNYIIDCNYTCGVGEIPNSSCDGCVIIDICAATSPCQNGGICVTLGSSSYYCICPSFHVGFNCEGIGYHMWNISY